jgi:hypothetical protein
MEIFIFGQDRHGVMLDRSLARKDQQVRKVLQVQQGLELLALKEFKDQQGQPVQQAKHLKFLATTQR